MMQRGLFNMLGMPTCGTMLQGDSSGGRRRPELPREEPRLRWPYVVVLVVVLLVMTAFWAPEEVAAVCVGLAVLATGLLLLYGMFTFLTLWGRRRATERIVVAVLSSIVRQNLPLATAVSLAARSERGKARVILRNIGAMLTQGLPLSEAIRLGFPNARAVVLSMVIAGESAGQLPASLDNLSQYLLEAERRKRHYDYGFWLYIVIVVSVMSFVLTGIMVAVVPKYQEIFKDFDTQLPAITRILIEVCAFLVSSGLLALLLPIGLLMLPVVFYLSLRPRRVPEPVWTSRWADWIRWHIPGLHRLEFSRGLALVLQTLRMGVQAGMSFSQAAHTAAGLDMNMQLRPRVRRFADLLSSGKDAPAAAREAQLGSAVQIALAAGARQNDYDAALRFAADYHAAVVSRLWILIGSLAVPVPTLIMGLIVGFVALALFLPLVALINSVSM